MYRLQYTVGTGSSGRTAETVRPYMHPELLEIYLCRTQLKGQAAWSRLGHGPDANGKSSWHRIQSPERIPVYSRATTAPPWVEGSSCQPQPRSRRSLPNASPILRKPWQIRIQLHQLWRIQLHQLPPPQGSLSTRAVAVAAHGPWPSLRALRQAPLLAAPQTRLPAPPAPPSSLVPLPRGKVRSR